VKIHKEYPVLIYVAGCLALFLIFSIFGTKLNVDAEIQIADLLAGEQVLQATAVRNAVNENLQRLVNESFILSTYSFPEYEEDVRTRTSMLNLFQIELESYQDSSAYSYLDYSGEKTISLSDSDSIGRKALKLAEQWESFLKEDLAVLSAPPLVPSMVTDDGLVFIGYLFPVYVGNQLRGSLTVVINLKQPIERYINPLNDALSGLPLVLDRDLRILWDAENRFSGGSLKNIYPSLDGSDIELLKRKVKQKTEGGFWLSNFDIKTDKAGRISFSWSSLEINEQKIIIALLSDEKELTALLEDHRKERTVLYASLSLSLIAASAVLLLVQRMTVNKRDLTAQVEAKTIRINNILERYTTLFDSANDAIILLKNRRIVDCNQRALELFEVDKRSDFIGLSPDKISPEFQSADELSVPQISGVLEDIKTDGARIFEWKHQTLKGRIFDAEISVRMIHIDNEDVAQAIVRDISERVHAMEEKDVMMKEIHHRVKNNLQIINSFLNLQQQHLTTPEANEAVVNTQRRVDAMAKMHEMLYGHDDLARISTSEYYSEIINFFKIRQDNPNEPRLLSELEEIELDPDRCMYTGFILSELIDNALKHSGNNRDIAVVKVVFKVADQEGVLSVEDQGAGFVPEPGKLYSGLGLQLVSALKIQLKGKLEWSGSEGTRVIFRFPLSAG